MSVVGDALGQFKPTFSLSGGFGTILTIIAILVFVGIIMIFITYLIIMSFKYNKKITIFENIAGQGYVPTGKDKAILVKVGDSGEEILKLRRRKLFRTAYGKRMGKNKYFFAIGDDGYWYNIVFGDLNKGLYEIGLKPIDKDVRYAYAGIRKNVKDNFGKKESVLIKMLPYIGLATLMLVFGIGMWFVTRNFVAASGSINTAMQTAKEVLQSSKEVIGALDNVVSGSGVISAGV